MTTTEPDYRAAFEFLRQKTARRAFAIVFTDLVDEEASRGLVAAVTQLAGNNLVLCCILAGSAAGRGRGARTGVVGRALRARGRVRGP